MYELAAQNDLPSCGQELTTARSWEASLQSTAGSQPGSCHNPCWLGRPGSDIPKVTGKSARTVRVTPEEDFAGGYEPLDTDKKLAYGTDGSDSTLQSAGENFIGFFYVWRDNLAKRDYALLDKILPTRVKSDYTGEYKPVLIDVARGNFPIKGN
ncbi:hypothetical protein V1522DRAFT_403455, partial [Lipomyces starkeyi]